jgi:hypothetical protein
MERLKVTETAPGVWRACFDGEEDEASVDRSPDKALAGLVRANLRRFGVAEITYASEAAPPGEEAGAAGPRLSAAGEVVVAPPPVKVAERKHGH